MTFQQVMEQDEARRKLVEDVLDAVWMNRELRARGLSLAARIAFMAIGQGMRLVIDNPYEFERGNTNARMLPDPTFEFLKLKWPEVKVPLHVAKEMLSSGLMKKLEIPGTVDEQWWCMIQ